MSASGLPVFDETLQLTNTWLKEIMDELGPDRQRAYHALRAVLHALRDRLVLDEAAHLSAQLPMLVRGIFFEGWRPVANPSKERSREEFVAEVAKGLQNIRPIDPEDAIHAVFATLARHVTGGEIRDVIQMLPKDIQRLWPREARQGAAE